MVVVTIANEPRTRGFCRNDKQEQNKIRCRNDEQKKYPLPQWRTNKVTYKSDSNYFLEYANNNYGRDYFVYNNNNLRYDLHMIHKDNRKTIK